MRGICKQLSKRRVSINVSGRGDVKVAPWCHTSFDDVRWESVGADRSRQPVNVTYERELRTGTS